MNWGKNALLFITAAILAVVSLLLVFALVVDFVVEDSPTSSQLGIGGRTSYQPHTTYIPLVINTPLPVLASESYNTKIDFTSQAPFGVWDALHEETCEEAALVMVYAWVNSLQFSPEFAEKEMLKLVEWQKSNLGYFENTSAGDTAKIAQTIYGLNPKILENPSVKEIKFEIRQGNIVLMGMAGKLLNNPFFKPPGPAYHMLLLRGFDEKGFFVNDPGTRRGNNFFYTYENLMEAAHDWNGSEETLLDSPPIALVFSR